MDAALHEKMLGDGGRAVARLAAPAIGSILEYRDTRPQQLACKPYHGSTGGLQPEA